MGASWSSQWVDGQLLGEGTQVPVVCEQAFWGRAGQSHDCHVTCRGRVVWLRANEWGVYCLWSSSLRQLTRH